jgi:hypothetical protein
VAYDVIEGEWQDVRQRLWENAGSAFVICSRATVRRCGKAFS